MKNSLQKRGQKFLRRFSRASVRASESGKEHIKENLIQRIAHIKNIRLLIFEWCLLIVALIMLSITQAYWFGDSYASDTFSTGGTYTEATIGKINSLNPLFATTNSEKVLSRLMFATLSEVDYTGHPGLGLAESIRSDEDGKVWTLKLRDGLKWSDGEALTNDDVIFTIELIQNPSVNSVYDANLSNVTVELNDNNEIIFTLPAAYADFISALNIPIVPKHILENANPKTLIEHDFSKHPVTSGAFTLNATQTSTENEKIVYLSSNPNYYRGKPLVNTFAVHAYDEKADIINALNAGTITATAELSATDSSSITSDQVYQKNSSINSGIYLFFNTTASDTKSRTLRSAIRTGLDLATLRSHVSDLIPIDYPFLQSQIELENYPELASYDKDAAIAKIAEIAGEEQITLNLVTVNSGYLPTLATELVSQLETLGLKVNLSIYEETQDFITSTISQRDYDILLYEIELGADPDLLSYYHSSQATSSGLNLSNYQNSIVDDLLLSARKTLDKELRIKKYESFLEYWYSEVPAIAIAQSNMTYYYNKNVRTYGDDIRLITPLDRFSNVTSWAVNKETKNRTP